jgi:hypothetical protein
MVRAREPSEVTRRARALGPADPEKIASPGEEKGPLRGVRCYTPAPFGPRPIHVLTVAGLDSSLQIRKLYASFRSLGQ